MSKKISQPDEVAENPFEGGVLHEMVQRGEYKPLSGYPSNGLPKLKKKSYPLDGGFVHPAALKQSR